MIFDKDPTGDDRTGFDASGPMIDAFNASRQEMLDQTRIVMREMQQTQGRALEYESFTTTVTAGTIAQIAGFDLSRLKMKLHAHGSGVYIGMRTQIVGGSQGYRLPAGGDVEFTAVDEVYAMLTPNTSALATNLVPNPAPSGTLGTAVAGWGTNYGTGGSGTFNVTSDARFPNASNTAGTMTFASLPTTALSLRPGGNGVAVKAGQNYSFSGWFAASWVGTFNLRMRWLDAKGSAISDAVSANSGAVAGTVYRMFVSTTAPANATSVELSLINSAGFPQTAGDTLVASSMSLTMDADASGYFDGNTSGYRFLPDGTSQANPAPVAVSVWVEKSAQ